MANPVCLKEDQKLAIYIICDVIEYGLSSSLASQYLSQVLPILYEHCSSSSSSSSVRQMSAYALGISSSIHSLNMSQYFISSLQVLAICISIGDDDDDNNNDDDTKGTSGTSGTSGISGTRGPCTDTACGSVAIILEVAENLNISLNYHHLWHQVLSYLPIVNDHEEAIRVHGQVIRLLLNNNNSINTNDDNRIIMILKILLEIYGTEYSNSDIDGKICQYLRVVVVNDDVKNALNVMNTSFIGKFDTIIKSTY